MIVHLDRQISEQALLDRTGWDFVGPGDEDLAQAEAAVVGGVVWDAARFDLAPRLRVLARAGIGVDAVDLAEATRRGVLVTNTPDGPTVSTAEHAIALMFAVAKTLPAHQQRLREAAGGYGAASTAIELDGLTLGLVAFGRIARRVARIAAAVGMNIVANDPYLTDGQITEGGATIKLVDFDELLAVSDVISLHAPLTAETRMMFSTETFARVRPGLIFVNAARGGLVDTDALLHALDQGLVAGAGLDVTEPEPLAPDHPLLHRADVIVTPHVASSTVAGRRRMLTMAFEQVAQVIDGQRPSHLVNVELWDAL